MDSLNKAVRRTLLKLGSAAGRTDGELLTQFVASGDQAAFEELLRRHGAMVLRVCRRVLQHAQDAEDAFQATFIVLARKAHALTKRELVANWLYGVAYRVARKAKTSAGQRHARAARSIETADQRPAAPVDDKQGRDLQPVLDEEINRLPEKLRSAIVLCYLQGKTNEEAAQMLHCQLGAVTMRLTRARYLLRERLARRGLTLPAAAFGAILAQEGASAALPTALQSATVQTVVLHQAGDAGGLSAGAAALANETLQGLFRAKVKLVAASVLVLAVAALGIYLLVRGASSESVGAGSWQVQARFQTDRPIVHAAYSRDGRRLAVATDNLIRLLDGATGAEHKRMQYGDLGVHYRFVNRVVFSADGNLLAAATLEIPSADHAILLWDATTGAERGRLSGHEKWVYSVVFSPDGKLLASASDDGTIRLWETATRRQSRLWINPARPIPYKPLVASRWVNGFSPDGKTLIVTGADRMVRLWDVQTGVETRTFAVDTPGHYAPALCPDGRLLAAGQIWDLDRGMPTATLSRPIRDDMLHAFSFSPDGLTCAAGRNDGTALLWETRTGRLQAALRGQLRSATAVCFTPDGQAIAVAGAADDGGLIELWLAGGRR